MDVSLTPELEDFIGELVKSGNYFSASEVVRGGLRLLKEREEIRRMRRGDLRKEITKGIEDLESGRSKSFSSTEKLFEEIKDGGKKLLQKSAASLLVFIK